MKAGCAALMTTKEATSNQISRLSEWPALAEPSGLSNYSWRAAKTEQSLGNAVYCPNCLK
jgi:hypothetical protein